MHPREACVAHLRYSKPTHVALRLCIPSARFFDHPRHLTKVGEGLTPLAGRRLISEAWRGISLLIIISSLTIPPSNSRTMQLCSLAAVLAVLALARAAPTPEEIVREELRLAIYEQARQMGQTPREVARQLIGGGDAYKPYQVPCSDASSITWVRAATVSDTMS